MKDLILMMGVCCSGKTTYAKNNFLPGVQYLSEKALSKGIVQEGTNVKDKDNLLYFMTSVCARAQMIHGFPVVVDDRNLSVESLVIWRKIAKEYNYRVTVVLMDTPLEVCRKRLKRLVDTELADKELITDFERLEDMKPILFSKHHGLELFDKIDVIKHGG